MVTQLSSSTQKDIIYPESDGQPMAEHNKLKRNYKPSAPYFKNEELIQTK